MAEPLLSSLLADLPSETPDISALWVYRGAVAVRSTRLGFCALPPAAPPPRQGRGDYADLPDTSVARAAAELLSSKHPVDRAVGLAALDSALPVPEDGPRVKLTEHLLPRIRDLRICFVGHFPRADAWRARGLSVEVVELAPEPGDVPWRLAGPTLQRAEAVLITGQTLVNGTLPEVLEATRSARVRGIMGPSVPMAPSLLDLGLHVLGPSWIREEEAALAYWQHGGFGIRRMASGVTVPVCIES